MTQLWAGMRPVAQAAVLACVWGESAMAADAPAAALPETTVAAPAQQADALDPAQTPYATELLNRAEMERQQVLDIRDATRDMVNVEVPRQPARGTGISGTTGREGNTGFEIRGLGGNRVQMLVDGIPQPEADSFMNSHSFGRDYVDPLTLSSIEVHKGVSPVSMPGWRHCRCGQSAHAVALGPAADGKTLAGRALLGWRSESQGLTAGAVLAGKASDQLQWLFALNGDWSDETETMGRVGAQASSAPGQSRGHSPQLGAGQAGLPAQCRPEPYAHGRAPQPEHVCQQPA
jgi:hemoglobin/transferrin/lactoferrin receptor protein